MLAYIRRCSAAAGGSLADGIFSHFAWSNAQFDIDGELKRMADLGRLAAADGYALASPSEASILRNLVQSSKYAMSFILYINERAYMIQTANSTRRAAVLFLLITEQSTQFNSHSNCALGGFNGLGWYGNVLAKTNEN